ncbi:MAG: metal ABC transporter permease [Verrucomicrobia bacterium]|nr:metal ABC transporter permease [Verrucomicrobiota bacterium]
MGDFFRAVIDPDLVFLRYALIMAVLASVAFGVVGTFVVARRISYIAGAIAHAILGGIGLAVYLNRVHGWLWLEPLHGALLAAIASALIMAWVRWLGTEREDSVIGAIWSVGMAVGLLFLALSPGYSNPTGYLFGNILLISKADLWLVFLLDIIVLTVALLFYPQLQAVCFDEEGARLRGVATHAFYALLLCLTGVTIVLLVSVVGIVLVVALLTLPAAIAGQFASTFGRMMAGSCLLCLTFSIGGLGLSYNLDWPTGPAIILLAGSVYLVVFLGRRIANSLFALKRSVKS